MRLRFEVRVVVVGGEAASVVVVGGEGSVLVEGVPVLNLAEARVTLCIVSVVMGQTQTSGMCVVGGGR